jgi:hypothetical protein
MDPAIHIPAVSGRHVPDGHGAARLALAWPPVMIPSEPGTMPRRRGMQPSRTKQGRVGALDGFGNLRVGGVDQLAHLAAESVLPAGQGIDTVTDARAGGVCHSASAPCQHRQGQASRTPWPVANRRRMVAGNTPTPPTSRRAIRQPLGCGDEFAIRDAGRASQVMEPITGGSVRRQRRDPSGRRG